VTEKKNVIIISMDEVRPDHLSCCGYQKLKTPAIDRVAEEGVVFGNIPSSIF
jgi:arylsulfatase A-like enzyme